MPIIKSLFILILLLGSLTARSQTNGGISIISLSAKAQSSGTMDFAKFIVKTFNLSDSLKYNCEWMYAVVKVKTDNNNKIIKYEVLNNALDEIKNSFKFLIGYQFPKTMKINGRPIVFYFSVDNTEICKPKSGDFIHYYPNQVVEKIASMFFQLKESDPTAIFVPQLIFKTYYAPIK